MIADNLGFAGVWAKNLALLGSARAIVTSGTFLGGEVAISLQRIDSLNQRIIGVRTGTIEAARRAWDQAQSGFRAVVDRVFPLKSAPAAHRYAEENRNVGRVLLLAEGRR